MSAGDGILTLEISFVPLKTRSDLLGKERKVPTFSGRSSFLDSAVSSQTSCSALTGERDKHESSSLALSKSGHVRGNQGRTEVSLSSLAFSSAKPRSISMCYEIRMFFKQNQMKKVRLQSYVGFRLPQVSPCPLASPGTSPAKLLNSVRVSQLCWRKWYF